VAIMSTGKRVVAADWGEEYVRCAYSRLTRITQSVCVTGMFETLAAAWSKNWIRGTCDILAMPGFSRHEYHGLRRMRNFAYPSIRRVMRKTRGPYLSVRTALAGFSVSVECLAP